MHTLLGKILLTFISILVMSFTTLSAQDKEISDFTYQINIVQKYLSISPAQLNEANTLSDLNHYYKSDWVKEYKSVQITTMTKGKKSTLTSITDQLTSEQKQAIINADNGSDIEVAIKYSPSNNLSSNDVKKMDFSFRIDPERVATYKDGQDKLDQYISETIMKKVTLEDVPQYQVAAVKFTIDEEGQVIDAHVAQSSTNTNADQLILNTVCEMPKWQSAKYTDGTKTKQEFVLTVGDHYSCTMNVLDIKSEVPPSTRNQ